MCGCGKRYQSYSSLYSHVKLKHDNVFPEGTITVGPHTGKRLTVGSHTNKRGRPKKVLLRVNNRLVMIVRMQP